MNNETKEADPGKSNLVFCHNIIISDRIHRGCKFGHVAWVGGPHHNQARPCQAAFNVHVVRHGCSTKLLVIHFFPHFCCSSSGIKSNSQHYGV